MFRLFALALVGGFVSVVSAGVNVSVVNVTGGQARSFGPGNFGSSTSFSGPALSTTYGAAGFPGGSLNTNYPTPFGFPSIGQNYGGPGFPGGFCNIGFPAPFGPGFCGGNFGCGNAFGPGFCGVGFGGFGGPAFGNRVWTSGPWNSQRFSANNSIYYAPWYDQGYAWSGPWGAENYGYGGYGYGYPTYPVIGALFSTASDNGYYAPAPPRSQVIHFPAPLEQGKAQIKITPPAAAEVLVNGQAIGTGSSERVFTTPVIDGPTNYDVKVRQTINGKVDEQTFRLSVKPGDRQQVIVLR